ncbi:MAG: hypothetical protein LQ351_001909 [Letrouitia transgressa]|nr:MAG: hypothetical protein LQ351_001909 [Letrouitia transgressa]
MKRKASSPTTAPSKSRRSSQVEKDYFDVDPRRADDGAIIWPASASAIESARDFLRECAKSSQKTLIVPDKDADGLDAGVILLRTLTALGLAPESVGVHLLDKHSTVHDESERQAMQAKDPKYIIVVDHGSIEAPPIVDSPETKCLLIDHHLSDKFPRDAIVGKTRRTARYDVISAWDALVKANGPKDILRYPRLLDARAEINEEVEFRTHAPPKFSKDGKIAVLRIHSKSQVHGVIATRWAGYLNSKMLEIVMVANSGYRPGYVNFSCRIARTARHRDPPINIIESLRAVAKLDQGDLVERMGDSFARGHKEASGGIIPSAEFEELMTLMQIGEKPDPKPGEATKKVKPSPQKNNLLNYFSK